MIFLITPKIVLILIKGTDKISIGYLGRFETQKGIPSIFEAITALPENPASTITFPNGSLIEGTTNISILLKKS